MKIRVTCTHLVILITFLTTLVTCQEEGSPPSNCTRFYRSIQRSGGFISGQLTIPMSSLREESLSLSMGYKLQLKFSRAIRAVQARQVIGRDMGTTHREFMIDTTAKEGKLKVNTMLHLRNVWGPPATVTRIVFNSNVLCGAPLSQTEANESIIVNSVTKTTTPSTSTTTQKSYEKYKPEPLDQDYY